MSPLLTRHNKMSKRKGKRKNDQAGGGQKVVVGARDQAGNIIIGDYKRTNALGDIIMYLFIGIFVVMLFVFGSKAYEVISKTVNKSEGQAGLPDVTTGATALPSVIKSTESAPMMTTSPVATTTEVPLPMEQPDIPVSTSPPVTGGSTTMPATKPRLSPMSDLMKRVASSVNYKKMDVNNNRGPSKMVVVPGPWKMNAMEVDSIYNIKDVVVAEWNEIPLTSFSVTISFRMANPPLVQHNPDFFHVVLNTDPFENGLVVAMPDKDHYRISVGNERSLLFKRPQAHWSPDHEVFQIRFIQLSPDQTRIETIFNGHESVLKNNAKVPINTLRSLPSKVKIKDPFKIENFWVSYAP